MALDDYVEPEVGVAVAVTAVVSAAVASPRVRKALRRGTVYGLAGLMMAYDKVSALAHNAARSAREMAGSVQDEAQNVAHQEPHPLKEPATS
jgi:hypothetical protein